MIDLPEDEPELVELLIQYLYENEYEPRLYREVSSKEEHDETTSTILVVGGRKDADYHYGFPHTCGYNCLGRRHLVCPHHRCGRESCGKTCVNFICETCCSLKGSDSKQLLLHAQMYSMGDKFDIKGLKELAHKKFKVACALHWDRSDFFIAANYACTSTPDSDKGLRDVIGWALNQRTRVLDDPDAQSLLNEFNGVATSVLKWQAATSRERARLD